MINLRVSLYALMLAAAGIPLYIHLPRFASVELGLGLGAVGTILLAIRVVDLVQDPFIGWMIDRWPRAQTVFGLLAALGLAAGFPLLFFIEPGQSTALRLTATLILLFSAYSLGMILLYGRSASLAAEPEAGALMSIAAWRETGMLAGVVLAAAAPSALAAIGADGSGYPAFGLLLCAVSVIVGLATLPLWKRPAQPGRRLSLPDLAGSGGLRLLALALINNLPVAITSTLFVFFVEDRLQLQGRAGPFLILFFLAAGLSVPAWNAAAHRIGARATLLIAMPLAVAGFIGAAFLPTGASLGFAVICVASGAATGADLVLLPAMFSIALTRAGLNAGEGFGIWSVAGKLGLALAAFLVLPALGAFGFAPGEANTPESLAALNAAYAILPCLLKLVAIGFVLTLPTEE
ncbi:MFS transporter [Pseudoruegeria sp. HB172150]|uniref:MFS transporter n=1 Tax=Pseudoruegeria sp. HB172150 TaxID=2721164 RepID=UPI00155239FE|nr:MFS transporter [Pseudoruegeria sp. HB172150]